MSDSECIAYPPHAEPVDRALFDSARSMIPVKSDWRRISAEKLSEISRNHGIEIATAWWCDAIRNGSDQAEFVQAVEGCGIEAPYRTIEDPPTILLIRGAFYRQHRHTGADGHRIARIAGEMGWLVEHAEIHSFGSLETNAAIIIDYLLQTTVSRVLLVSLSKGSADVAMALTDPRAKAALTRVCGWVSISGITTGTPLVGWLRSHRMRTIGVHLLLWSRRQRFSVVDQLRHENGPLARPMRVPPHIRTIHVVGCPIRRHLRHPWASRGYDRIAPHGPTDGGGIVLADLARLSGWIYPVWGADHYLQPDWDLEPLIRNVLVHAARSDIQPNAIPTSRSSA